MSGRRIDDHKSWVGAAPMGQVYPDGAKVKHEKSVEGDGHIGTEYSDTTEMIAKDQEHGDSKMKSHKMKAGYRY